MGLGMIFGSCGSNIIQICCSALEVRAESWREFLVWARDSPDDQDTTTNTKCNDPADRQTWFQRKLKPLWPLIVIISIKNPSLWLNVFWTHVKNVHFWAKTEYQDLVLSHIYVCINIYIYFKQFPSSKISVPCNLASTDFCLSGWTLAVMSMHRVHGCYIIAAFYIGISITQRQLCLSRWMWELVYFAFSMPPWGKSFHPAWLNRKCPWLPLPQQDERLLRRMGACLFLDRAGFLWLHLVWPDVLGVTLC